MEALEKHDIQGLVLKGYGRMMHTRYVLLQVDDPARAKAWLADIAPEISDGNHSAQRTCLNVAFTYPGLKALGMRDESLRQFAREFREGLTEPHRQRLLGDAGVDAPVNWQWGGTSGDAPAKNVHVMLMVFAATVDVLEGYWDQLELVILAHGLNVLWELDGALTDDGKNAFGFNDGIAQPDIAGNHPDTRPDNTVAAGEFLLGYKNEYGVLPESPYIAASDQQGDVSLLPTVGLNQKDLGRNGSYLVFRQMQIHRDEFWDFVREKSAGAKKEPDWLASKMFGRWPSGAPLVLFPDADPGGEHYDVAFGYADDQEGLRCPIGSHIRRANPRDDFEDNGPAKSLSLTKKHRLIRRGRNYEKKAEVGTKGEEIGKKDAEVGLHFACFNADIAEQFEFIQHTWANYPHFNELHNDPDPIIGVASESKDGAPQNFTVPQCPVNWYVLNLPRFVTIRGGAYFFFPSLKAIRYLATI
jgi:Dyp-type peroxidase family